MTRKYYLGILLLPIFFIFFAPTLAAQTPSIEQPCSRILLGIQSDSLEWTANPCIDFIAYEIYRRPNSQSNFTLLQTINDPNTQLALVNNTGEVYWEYQIRMICASTIYNTIIVDNQRPVTPNLTRVYIANNKPVVEWEDSPSNDVVAYQLYKEVPYGSGDFFPYPAIGQLQRGNQFVDVDATDLLARYAIVAESPCNKSLLGEGGIDNTTGPHTSIVIRDIDIDTCAQALTINWTAYENWREGVLHYEIWAKVNGGLSQILATTSNTTYVLSPLDDDTTLEFFIKAVEKNGNGNSANSDIRTITMRTNRPVAFAHFTNITYTTSGELQVNWAWDTNADIVLAELVKNNANTLMMTNNPLQINNSYTDNNINNTELPFYKINTKDECGYEKNSAIAQPIHLQAQGLEGYQNKITFTPLVLENFELYEYQLYKVVGNNAQRIAILQDTFFIDEIDTRQNNQYEVCYYVVANGALRLENQPSAYISSRSNTACALQNAALIMPNAFAPNGQNREFKPAMVFGRSIENYTLQIYNRYGGLVFTSNNVFVGWDGKQNGEELPMGVYVYTLQYQQPDGETIKSQGTVMLLR